MNSFTFDWFTSDKQKPFIHFKVLVWTTRARHVLASKKFAIKKIVIKVRIRIYL